MKIYFIIYVHLVITVSGYSQEPEFYSNEISKYETVFRDYGNDFKTFMFNPSEQQNFEAALILNTRATHIYYQIRTITRFLLLFDLMKNEKDKFYVHSLLDQELVNLLSEKDTEIEAIISMLSRCDNQALIIMGNDYKNDLRDIFNKLEELRNRINKIYGTPPKIENTEDENP